MTWSQVIKIQPQETGDIYIKKSNNPLKILQTFVQQNPSLQDECNVFTPVGHVTFKNL